MICPQCNYLSTNHETIGGEKDYSEGDISFCISCGEYNEFKGKGLIKFEGVETQEMKDITHAWLRTRNLVNTK